MSSDDFSVSDSSSDWGYDKPKSPPKSLMWIGITSVAIGALWSILCLVDVNGWSEIEWMEPKFIEGFIGYVLTLWVPLFSIVYLRMFQAKHVKSDEGYDSYAGLVLANRLKFLAITGLVFSLVAIYIAVLPLAEKWAAQ